MKKFLCMTMLMLAALTASAGGSVKAASPPEQDIATPAGRGRHDACRLPMARLQARMYDHGCDYTYDVPHSRWRIPFYDSAHGQTLSNPASGHEPLASHGLKIRVRSSS